MLLSTRYTSWEVCVKSVRRIRLEKGLSQQELADESGVGQDTISGIESGRHEPRPSTLRKLAAALEVEVVDFFRESALAEKAEAPETGRAVVGVGTTPEEATEYVERQLYEPAKIALDWYQLAQLFSDELEKVEKGHSEASSLWVLIDTLENVALSMEATVAAEEKELRARYDDEDTVRRKAVLRPVMNRLSVLVGEALQKIDTEKLEAEAEQAGKLKRLEHRFKMAG
jgi:transcriptional regulator with XRE-family HTH domain